MNDALRASYRFCGDVSRRQARNFYYSFLLLPADLRRSMCALYAFLRHTDDLADDPAPARRPAPRPGRLACERPRRALGRRHRRTGPACPRWPTRSRGTRSPIATSTRSSTAWRWTWTPGRSPPSTTSTATATASPRRSGSAAFTSGAIRSDGGRAEALAEACGIALQLTNILRDVREDARNGRVYLPREDLDRFGVRPEDLTADRPGDRAPIAARLRGPSGLRLLRDRPGRSLELVAPVGRPVLAYDRRDLPRLARRDRPA